MWLSFEYLTHRIRISPKDLQESPRFSRPAQLHFICSPNRATEIVDMVNGIDGWKPLTIYEPIPVIRFVYYCRNKPLIRLLS